ncbi:putative bifunctional diguanylate cyclase/phosphodiesterase [Coralloluteibacterium thermophilus]|uniref:Bifunctional diguanylate cyclase/phosphodiesterase n=1 Tax=Coralloluteibacterium thermophilum TaxID=2707049 RepID=A0ABV9NMK9_9GAMM
MLASAYDRPLVLISIAIAVLAAYTALDMAGRVSAARGSARLWWLGGGTVAMGFGIWSMHFIGMLAFRLPIEVGYDIPLTALSLLLALAASALALGLVSGEGLPRRRLIVGMVVMGGGIAGMHYTGMAAMKLQPGIVYDPLLVLASLVIAVGASGAALWIAFRLRRGIPRVRLRRLAAAALMGAAIAGMHYTGMAAAGFPEGSLCGGALNGLGQDGIAGLVIVIALAVLAVALLTSVLDARMEQRTAVLADSLAAANAELTQLAMQDPLTRLPNRVLLEDRASKAMAAARREGAQLALLFIDLDGFKAVNDAFGHHGGDRLLVEVAGGLAACVRAEDTLARLGGDEFVLLARIDTPSDAAALAERVLAELRLPRQVEGTPVSVGASVGIALFPHDGDDMPALLAAADAAMYHAKGSGRGTYSYFAPSMTADARAQLQLIHELGQALGRREFVLHYQPKFEAGSGVLAGAEALLRWNHPERGLLAPADFIDLAERTGLILQIGEWVLDEACRQLRAWREQGRPPLAVAVNLSALQFSHPELVATVGRALRAHDVPPEQLILEITESTAMQDVEASHAVLEALSALGVRLSIDDFGTGYSSLLYLKRLPANELKIDRGFVSELARGSEDAAIVSAIVALGDALELTVVGEGVETRAQLEVLSELGCDALQGYLLGRPVPVEEFRFDGSAECRPQHGAAAAGAPRAAVTDGG